MADVAESGIVVVVPAAEPVVAEWRARWDSSAAVGAPAHVTLLAPFVPPPVPPDVVAALRSYLATVPSWTTRFATLARFPGGVLYVEPDPPDPYVALTAALAERWPQYPPYGGAYDTVVPHLTVCDGAPDDVVSAASAAIAERLPFTATVTEACLFEQSWPGGPCTVVARLPFAP